MINFSLDDLKNLLEGHLGTVFLFSDPSITFLPSFLICPLNLSLQTTVPHTFANGAPSPECLHAPKDTWRMFILVVVTAGFLPGIPSFSASPHLPHLYLPTRVTPFLHRVSSAFWSGRMCGKHVLHYLLILYQRASPSRRWNLRVLTKTQLVSMSPELTKWLHTQEALYKCWGNANNSEGIQKTSQLA